MDTQKLLKILVEIEKDEQEINIASKIENIRNSLSQNNLEGFSASQDQLNELVRLITETSRSYLFSRTEGVILESLGGEDFYGKGLVSKIQSITASRGFEIVKNIDEFKNLRNDFINKVQKLKNSLVDIGIEEYSNDLYEVAIILPESQDDAINVSKKIKEFEELIGYIQEISLGRKDQVKINRVSNGSLEFFTSQTADVALTITTLMTNIIVIWDKITSLKTKCETTKQDSTLSSEAKKDIEKILKKEISKIKEEIIEDLPKEILKKVHKNIDNGRKKEIHIGLSAKIKALFGWLEFGIEVDIVPVRDVESKTTGEVNENKEQYVQLLNEIRKLAPAMERIYELPKEQKLLPFKLDNGEEKTEEEDKITEETGE